ncbi:MAG TPA: hypothetical protein VML91_18775 [Burkholderiales bacterium]|nr:hypothetical protein [Burkholderiales bacterium]
MINTTAPVTVNLVALPNAVFPSPVFHAPVIAAPSVVPATGVLPVAPPALPAAPVVVPVAPVMASGSPLFLARPVKTVAAAADYGRADHHHSRQQLLSAS